MNGDAHPALRFVHSRRPALSPERVAATLREAWGLEGELTALDGDRDQNFALHVPDGRRYLLKIGQTGEDPEVIDLQVAALNHIAARDPGLCVPAVVPTRDEARTHALPAGEGGWYRFRLFSYLPGQPILSASPTPATLRAVGAAIARLDRALHGFFHPAAGHALLWDVRQVPALRRCAEAIADAPWRGHVLDVMDRFAADVLPRLQGLRAQVIHGDLTAENVLVDGPSGGVSGLIDFGDTVHAPLAQELAVAMADVPWEREDPWAAACELAAGFDEATRLEDEEIALLWDLARARLALTAAVLAARDAGREEGAGSMDGMTATCRRQLEALDAVGRDRALARLRETLRIPESAAPVPGDDAAMARRDALLARRRRSLMPGLALFYPERPVHAVRGEGMWLIDAAGRRYLDFYNNVPHVGHGHPHVVNAVARQAAALNTNTRYVYESIVAYAERLADRLPGDLAVVLPVNSGSEANDLAWRIARAVTGASGALVTAGAYHGVTDAVAALSAGEHGVGEVPGHVRTLRSPDTYRGPVRSDQPDPGAAYAGDADRAAAELRAAGHGLAAFMVDSTFASDGILDPPAGYLERVFATVRAAGGLCIADEVQAGFGRLGTWWGFEAHDVAPDIVTLGKPMANGYPAGAVVSTPAIVSAFAAQTEYFSTFGGNPVACMASLAVLDVIEREGLVAAADAVGRYLHEQLAGLAGRHALIGDVRGRGLFVGVELVRDRATRAPAGDEATAAVLALRDRGVLVGTEGRHGNVLKIRPPMVCRRAHVDTLIEALDEALDEVLEVVGRDA